MANRVTVDEVKAIIDTTLTATIITAYIKSANVLVTSALGTTLGIDVLKEIERWLAAHMIASTKERQAKEEEAGGAKIKYAGEWGKGLLSTSYGQMVLALDSTGVFLVFTEGRRFAWSKAIPQFD